MEPQDYTTGQVLTVEVWSDVACPWCYIGTRRFAHGIERFHATHPGIDVQVEYRSFLLTPDMPDDFAGGEADFLVHHKGVAPAQAQAILDSVSRVAADEGLEFDFATVRPANTVKAHELLHYAKAHGKQVDVNERLFRAHFCEGRHVGHVEELADLAVDVGLERDAVMAALGDGRHAADVEADRLRAGALGIGGIPFHVIDGTLGVAGAQAPETFAAALERAATERPQAEVS